VTEPIEVAPHKDVYEAMAAAMHDCGYVEKGRRMVPDGRGGMKDALGYSFASERAVLEEVRPAFIRHGLVAFVAGYERLDITEHERTNNYGKEQVITTARAIVQVRILHGQSGTHLDVFDLGEGADFGDKALGKVTTYAFKGALRRAMMLVTGDDPDETPSSEYEREPDQQRRPPAQRQQQRPKAEPPPRPSLADRMADVVPEAATAETWQFPDPKSVQEYVLEVRMGPFEDKETRAAAWARFIASFKGELKRKGIDGNFAECMEAMKEADGDAGLFRVIDQAIKDAMK
jgi:hypothetical protein